MIKKEITIDGIRYDSINDFCKKKKIKYDSLYHKLKRYNLDVNAKNIERYLKNDIKKEITILGEKVSSEKEFAKKYGIISVSYVRNLLKKKGKPLTKKTFNEYLNGVYWHGNGNAKEIIINGKKYRSIRNFCQEEGVNIVNLMKWLKSHKKESTSKIIEQWYNNHKK